MRWQTRRAVPDDVPEIAAINVAAWRSAYAGLIPDAVLDGMSERDRAAAWLRVLAEPDPAAVFVATGDDGRVGAYCAVGAPSEAGEAREPSPTGELFSIYAAPWSWGTGAGHAVHERAWEHLRATGFRHAVLWVFAANASARRFYESHGWRCDEVVQLLRIGDEDIAEIRYSRPIG
ncbi:GNAT family N-acetyltransferase [Streptoalloteichus hindustanus]|uniref:L-amino acid N-acyltransferase YncA n=1 Tax=Streptoalloteichus hindustanus TaxID=2017 RepID=A0A1M5HF38_STRHI|nr:GNAT family N-acetyltransferase [Streptoalloteichus hindustanus]SHG14599.1 L-amino acid N-acyltransferase YncA [Streptoalloteichus hindustanus]